MFGNLINDGPRWRTFDPGPPLSAISPGGKISPLRRKPDFSVVFKGYSDRAVHRLAGRVTASFRRSPDAGFQGAGDGLSDVSHPLVEVFARAGRLRVVPVGADV